MRQGRTGAGWWALTLAVAISPVIACRPGAEAVADGDDPLAALRAPAQSARYGGPFWAREAHRGSRTWRAARAFCDGRDGRDGREWRRERQLPNCQPVELVERWEELALLQGMAGMPALPAPPPAPPRMHPGESRQVGADVAALRAWEERLAARGRAAAREGRW
jgi:hypothetical protein